MAAFETPPLGEYPMTPPVREGAMAHSKPYVAKPDLQKRFIEEVRGDKPVREGLAVLYGRS